MKKYNFVKTQDLSTGLYSYESKDIFHSITGALTEAYDKFVMPSSIVKKDNIKLLDICSGIGYNTKAYIYKNKEKKIHVDSFEMERNFSILSPFIDDKINDLDLKIFLIEELLKNGVSFYEIYDVLEEHINLFGIEFFNPQIIDFIQRIKNYLYSFNGRYENNLNLHNIYYKNISNNMNMTLNSNKYNNMSIRYYFGDARVNIKLLHDKYDIVFLDAFSPQKDPTLWTINFLSEIKNKMKCDSILLSYSKSTPFRSALNNLNFYIGKTYIDKKDMGTVASLTQSLILNPISEYDNKLYETKSGIVYKDKLLKLSPDEILLNRDTELKNSNRLSRTKFLKLYSQ